MQKRWIISFTADHFDYRPLLQMNSLKISYERKLTEAFDEIEDLRRELKKFVSSAQYQGDYDEDDFEDGDSCEEDPIEIVD
jgi:hypothetical protein